MVRCRSHENSPTVVRAMALNLGQLGGFSQAKRFMRDSVPYVPEAYTTFAASAVAGFFAAFFSLPFDFVKTQLQSSGGNYKGFNDCVLSVYRQNGITHL
jgi:solute carrier family 25 (mitochondrial oxoglutarate transporter), member 11